MVRETRKLSNQMAPKVNGLAADLIKLDDAINAGSTVDVEKSSQISKVK